MAKSTTGLAVAITRVPSAVTGVTAPVNLVTGAEELNLGEFKKMTTIVESTGVGVDKRKRLDQGLQDLASMTISALYDSTAADDFTRVFNAIQDSHQPFELTVTWETGKSVAADWLVEDVAIPTDVGAFTKTSATLQSAGTWTITL